MPRRIELGALVALGIAVAGGLIWVGQMSQSIRTIEENQTTEATRALKEEIETIRLDVEDIAVDRFSSFPVGSIIPFVGDKDKLESFTRWKICDGSVLKGEEYKDSPFYNRPLPKLDGVFLRATLSKDSLLKPGGSDTHKHIQSHTHQLSHTHSGKTEAGDLINFKPDYDRHDGGGNHTHDFTTNAQNNATTTSPSVESTGEDTSIPRHINVFYVIKVI